MYFWSYKVPRIQKPWMDYCEDPVRSCEHLNTPAHLNDMLLRKIKQPLKKRLSWLHCVSKTVLARSSQLFRWDFKSKTTFFDWTKNDNFALDPCSKSFRSSPQTLDLTKINFEPKEGKDINPHCTVSGTHVKLTM